jgi:hypothetical protein
MKAAIIGTDFLEYSGSVKVLEINTNTTFFNQASDELDYDSLFSILIENNINEFHFIYNEDDAYIRYDVYEFKFEERIKEKCIENNIEYFSYKVQKNSITVPYIEDANNKFILRQAFDTTALIDETYCADKFEFFALMSGSSYIPNTFFSSSTLISNEFNDIINYPNGEPNVILKSRYPLYDIDAYPAIYKLDSQSELEQLKSSLSEDILIQEFIFDNTNIIDNRWNIIRGIDIIYGPNLDIINMGGYSTSTLVDMDFCDDEYNVNTKKLSNKSRYKWVNKVNNFEKIPYHVDSDSLILDASGSLQTLDNIHVNDLIRTLDFTNIDGYSASDDLPESYGKRWQSTIEQTRTTLSELNTNVDSIQSQSVSDLYIKITLEDGTNWTDLQDTKFYIQLSGSNVTQFDKLNNIIVGDKLLIYDKDTSEISTKGITNLEIVYDSKITYALNVEPSDLFLVDINSTQFAIQHNPDCYYCGWFSCGDYSCDYTCFGCPGYGKSDISYKENLNLIGKSASGLNIYQFNYIGEEGLYEGLIAQELIGTKFESALSLNSDGKYLVDYNQVDVEFKKIN